MMFDRKMKKCNCGFGDGFYHYGSDSIHEYNPQVSEEQATSTYEVDRNPAATIYGHIDGRRVVVDVDGKETSFKYCDYGNDRDKAFAAAVRSLLPDCRQTVMF